MANNEFDEVQKKPDVSERASDSDPLADFRMARHEGNAVTEKSDTDAFGSLDLTQDDPLAKKAVEDAFAELNKSSDLRAVCRGDDLQGNLDAFSKMTPEQRDSELQRWQQYVNSLDNAVKTVDRAYGVN